jgi:hypothetical protein
MKNRLSVVPVDSRKCPVCNSSKFKETLVEFKELGAGRMKMSLWCCGCCHFEYRKGELVGGRGLNE